jgi:hypothetical protein
MGIFSEAQFRVRYQIATRDGIVYNTKGSCFVKSSWMISLFLLALILGNCTNSLVKEFPPPAEPKIVPSGNPRESLLQLEPTQEPTEMSSAAAMEKFVTLAKQDLAGRLGIEIEKITLVKSAEKLWLNAALGCPRPGVVYPTGRVPGFQIWLEVAGTEYVCNTDFNGTLILCPELNPHAPTSTNDPTPGVPIK